MQKFVPQYILNLTDFSWKIMKKIHLKVFSSNIDGPITDGHCLTHQFEKLESEKKKYEKID